MQTAKRVAGRRWICICCFVLATCLIAALHPALAGEFGKRITDADRQKVFSILRAGGFSNALDDTVEITRAGTVQAGGTKFELLVYVHTFPPLHPEGFERVSKRLIVLSSSHYVGMYAIDQLPARLKGNVLEFPGKKASGNSIVFDSSVPPPEVYLDGEVRPLYK